MSAANHDELSPAALKTLNRAMAQAEAAFSQRLQAQVQDIERLKAEGAKLQQASAGGLAEAQVRIEALQAALTQEREQSSRLQAALDEERNRGAGLQTSLAAAIAAGDDQAAGFEARMVDIEAEHRAAVDLLEVRLAEVQARHQYELGERQADARQLRERCEAVEQRAEDLGSERLALLRQLEALSQAFADARAEGDARRADAARSADAAREAHDARVATLEARTLDLQQRLQAAAAAASALQAHIQASEAAHEQRLSALSAEHQVLTGKLRLCEAELSEAREHLRATHAELAAQGERMRGQGDDLAAKLSRAAGDLQDADRRLLGERLAHEEFRARAAQRTEQLQAAIGALEARIAKEGGAHAEERRRLHEMLATREAELGSQARTRESTHKRMQLFWQQASHDRDAELESTRQLLRQTDQRVQGLSLALERQQLALDTGRQREGRLEERLAQLQAEIDQTRSARVKPPAPPPEAPAPAPALPPPEPAPATAPVAAPFGTIPTPNQALHRMDIQHVNQLIAIRGPRFVHQAYRVLLGRAPDADGAAFYTARVAAANDKAAIVCELAMSPEGVAKGVTLAGLPELLAAYRPVQGRVRRWLKSAARTLSSTARLEYALDEAAEDGARKQQALEALEAHMARLDARIAQEAAIVARESALARSQLIDLSSNLARCNQTLAELPGGLRAVLNEAEARRAPPPPPATPAAAAVAPAPERASALSLQFDAAGGATRLLDALTCGLAASAEARTLATRTPS